MVERVRPLLTEREAYAYGVWCKSEQPQLAPSTNAKLFNLFLQGKSTEDIRRLNQTFSLGQIVAARIEGDWDELRRDHLEQLLKSTSLKVQQATLESAEFVCDLLAVANKEHGDKLRRYLQSGDPKELGDFRISSLAGLKMAIETLQKLTGADRQQSLHVSGDVTHRAGTPAKQPTSEEASTVLKLLVAAR